MNQGPLSLDLDFPKLKADVCFVISQPGLLRAHIYLGTLRPGYVLYMIHPFTTASLLKDWRYDKLNRVLWSLITT